MRMMRRELPMVAHLIRLRLTTTYAVIVITPNDRFRSPVLLSIEDHHALSLPDLDSISST
jgi:hypothetical protein